MTNHPEPRWDLYAFAVVALFSLFQVMQWELSPKFLDMYYHLSVMKGFNLAGGFVTSSFWEFSPAGRPHLYPPVLHILMVGLSSFGLSDFTVGRLVEVMIYPMLLFTVWRVMRKLYSPRFAFLILVIWSSVYSLYLYSVTRPAFTLAFILALWLFYGLERKNVLGSILLMGLCFYTHTVMAMILWAAVLLYGLMRKPFLRLSLKVCLWGIVLALPFLIHIISASAFLKMVSLHENVYWEIDLVVYIMAGGGFFLLKKNQGKNLIPLSLFLASAPFVFTHSARFLSGHGMIALVWLAALCVDDMIERFHQRSKSFFSLIFSAGLVFVFFQLISPVLYMNHADKDMKIKFFDRPLNHYLWSRPIEETRGIENPIYFEKFLNPIVEQINRYTVPGEMIWSNFNYFSGLLAILTDRYTSDAMLPEVRAYGWLDPIRVARISIWLKEDDGSDPREMLRVVQRYGLVEVAREELAILYLNPTAEFKQSVRAALIPNSILFMMLGFCLLIVVYDFVRKRPS
jgi:hypothetical protein